LKSIRNNGARRLALAAVLAAFAAPPLPAGVTSVNMVPAAAGDEDRDPQRRPGGDRELPTSRASSDRNARDAELKCWQHGQLIYQDVDWRTGARPLPGPVLNSPTGRYGRLQLSDFGETFCILKSDRRGD
jgi:hypothetical protein